MQVETEFFENLMSTNTSSRGPKSQYWTFVSYENNINHSEDAKIQFFIVQREQCPSTNRLHWQGYIQFKKRQYRSAVQSYIRDPVAHCEPAKGDAKSNVKYCSKDDTATNPPERIQWGLCDENAGVRANKRKLDEVCQSAWGAKSREEAFNILVEQAPSIIFRSYHSVKAALDYRFPTKIEPFIYKPTFAWKLPATITYWLKYEFSKRERAKCLILVGPTRLGKTNWARSLGRHMFWRGQVNYGSWDQEAKYIVIDDIPWQFIPQKKSILTQMGDVTLTDKYVKKINVKNDKPAIILANEMPQFGEEQSYWEANTLICSIEYKLFNEDQLAI